MTTKKSLRRNNKLNKKGELKKVYEPQQLPVGTTVKMNKDNTKFIIEIPYDPKESSTGKSTLLASTGGNCIAPQIQVENEDGEELTVMLNVNMYAY